MRYGLIALCMLVSSLVTPAVAQLSINFGSPGVSIGINLPVYPTLQRIPGYPVYYAPGVNSNYFFYDGLYWVYDGDNWYSSPWYNGPWRAVDPFYVPLYVLRVPVRYYRHRPAYFSGWRDDYPPRWGDHWGRSWEQRRSGWDQWNRSSAPAPAPLPIYQKQYSGSNYPDGPQQAVILNQKYRYQPKDAVAQQTFQHQRSLAPAAQPQQQAPKQKAAKEQAPKPQPQKTAPAPREARDQPAPPRQKVERQPQQAPAAREPQAPRQQAQKAAPREQPAPSAAREKREQQAPRQQPQKVERQPQQAQERAPKAKAQDKGQGREKDDKEKGKDR